MAIQTQVFLLSYLVLSFLLLHTAEQQLVVSIESSVCISQLRKFTFQLRDPTSKFRRQSLIISLSDLVRLVTCLTAAMFHVGSRKHKPHSHRRSDGRSRKHYLKSIFNQAALIINMLLVLLLILSREVSENEL